MWNHTGDKVILRRADGSFEGLLFQQRRRQQEVPLKGIQNRTAGTSPNSNLDQARSNADGVHEEDFLLVTYAGLVTVIIGVAVSLILIVIGSFFKRKVQL